MYKKIIIALILIVVLFSVGSTAYAKPVESVGVTPNQQTLPYENGSYSGNLLVTVSNPQEKSLCVRIQDTFSLGGQTVKIAGASITGDADWTNYPTACGSGDFQIRISISVKPTSGTPLTSGSYPYVITSNSNGYESVSATLQIQKVEYNAYTGIKLATYSNDQFNATNCNVSQPMNGYAAGDYRMCALLPVNNSNPKPNPGGAYDSIFVEDGFPAGVGAYIDDDYGTWGTWTPDINGYRATVEGGVFYGGSAFRNYTAAKKIGGVWQTYPIIEVAINPVAGKGDFSSTRSINVYAPKTTGGTPVQTDTLAITPTTETIDASESYVGFQALLTKTIGGVAQPPITVGGLGATSWSSSNPAVLAPAVSPSGCYFSHTGASNNGLCIKEFKVISRPSATTTVTVTVDSYGLTASAVVTVLPAPVATPNILASWKCESGKPVVTIERWDQVNPSASYFRVDRINPFVQLGTSANFYYEDKTVAQNTTYEYAVSPDTRFAPMQTVSVSVGACKSITLVPTKTTESFAADSKGISKNIGVTVNTSGYSNPENIIQTSDPSYLSLEKYIKAYYETIDNSTITIKRNVINSNSFSQNLVITRLASSTVTATTSGSIILNASDLDGKNATSVTITITLSPDPIVVPPSITSSLSLVPSFCIGPCTVTGTLTTNLSNPLVYIFSSGVSSSPAIITATNTTLLSYGPVTATTTYQAIGIAGNGGTSFAVATATMTVYPAPVSATPSFDFLPLLQTKTISADALPADVSFHLESFPVNMSCADITYTTFAGSTVAVNGCNVTTTITVPVGTTGSKNDVIIARANATKYPTVSPRLAVYGVTITDSTLTAKLSLNKSGAKVNESITADITSTGGTGAKTYKVNFGDGSGDVVGSSVNHAFASSGTYTVTGTVTDANGTTATDSRTININKVVVIPMGDCQQSSCTSEPEPDIPTSCLKDVDCFNGCSGLDYFTVGTCTVTKGTNGNPDTGVCSYKNKAIKSISCAPQLCVDLAVSPTEILVSHNATATVDGSGGMPPLACSSDFTPGSSSSYCGKAFTSMISPSAGTDRYSHSVSGTVSETNWPKRDISTACSIDVIPQIQGILTLKSPTPQARLITPDQVEVAVTANGGRGSGTYRYVLDFGDGYAITLNAASSSVKHIYAATSVKTIYQITLRVSDKDAPTVPKYAQLESDVVSQAITAYAPLVCTLNMNKSVGLPPFHPIFILKPKGGTESGYTFLMNANGGSKVTEQKTLPEGGKNITASTTSETYVFLNSGKYTPIAKIIELDTIGGGFLKNSKNSSTTCATSTTVLSGSGGETNPGQ
ncbi:MAG: PKD domain-containing protein [Candidatus Paceibacterota bacterium]